MRFDDHNELPQAYFDEMQEERWRQEQKGFTLTQIASEGWDELEKTMTAYIRWAGQMQRMGSPDKARKRLMQVATMCLSRMQVLDHSGEELSTTKIPHDEKPNASTN